MSTLLPLETALLGLLHEKPMHPYEIEKTVTDRDMRCWTGISLSSVYKVLGKLEKKGLVEVKVELTGSNQAKKVYRLTVTGEQEVREKVRELVSEAEHMVYRVDIGLHNLHLLAPGEVKESFQRYIASIEEHERCFSALEQYLVNEGCPVHRLALAKRRLCLLAADREWARAFLAEYLA
jgi:DNA-binding PadR family transcriptional regulator